VPTRLASLARGKPLETRPARFMVSLSNHRGKPHGQLLEAISLAIYPEVIEGVECPELVEGPIIAPR